MSRTGPSAQLPDCRYYVQVSPVDKNDVDAQGFPGHVQSSPSGERVRYFSISPFPTPPVPESCAVGGANPSYISSRQAEGESGGEAWATEGVLPCKARSAGQLGFSEGLSETVVWATGIALTEGAPLTGRSYYLRTPPPPGAKEPSYRLLATVNSANPDEEDFEVLLAGFSGDGTHLVFETKEQLLPEATAGAPNTYEIDLEKPEGEQLSVVGILPGESGEAPPGGSVPGQGVNPWASFPGHVNRLAYTQGAVSVDGSRVFFTALPSERVYLRENSGAPASPIGLAGECTVPRDACTVAVSAGAARFRTATPDGAYAFYTEGEDLYRFNVETGAREPLATPVTAAVSGNIKVASNEVTDVEPTPVGVFHVGEEIFGAGLDNSTGEGGRSRITAVGEHTLTMANDAEETLEGDALSGAPGGVLGVLGASSDGRTVYFAASGVLAANANTHGETATNEPEVADLYESYQPASGPPSPSTTFIARLANHGHERDGDEEDWNDNVTLTFPVEKTSQVTGSGETVLFASRRSLTGYNSAGTEEIYRYQAGAQGAAGRLTCVSCNPNRETPPAGEAVLTGTGIAAAGGGEELTLTRNITENGRRVFFQTVDALVAADTNNQNDVYEWEADGEGTCSEETQDEGCLYLISSGTSSEQSYYGDASANGNNIFFFTRQALTPSDTDNSIDIYDARVCEHGEPCEEIPPNCEKGYQRNPVTTDCEQIPCYTAEECKPTKTEPPEEAFPATAAFNGPGNLVSTLIEKPKFKPKTPAQLRAEQLVKALKLCRKDRNIPKRHNCEKAAHKRYGPPKKPKSKKR